MKVKLAIILIMLVITFWSCEQINDNKEYTIKGQLLQSCDNPIPVSGVKLILDYNCDCNASKILTETFTDANGKFEFKYKSVAGNDIVISGSQPNGSGTQNYLFGIPINKDLNIGNLYSLNNFFTLVNILVNKQTTDKDTLYFDEYGANNFRQFIIGPFTNGQVLDTIVYRNAHFYDISNQRNYKHISHAFYSWKLGIKGKYNDIWTIHQPCLKYNYYSIEIK